MSCRPTNASSSSSSGCAGSPNWPAGQDVTATSLLEDFGFTGGRLTTRIGELSGGERRRLQVLRILLAEPNVLLLDEPTNDLDIDTLTVVEDYLDSWPGTLIVVSHDRYFLERVCDVTYALLGDGRCVLLPGGVDEYLARRRADRDRPCRRVDRGPGPLCGIVGPSRCQPPGPQGPQPDRSPAQSGGDRDRPAARPDGGRRARPCPAAGTARCGRDRPRRDRPNWRTPGWPRPSTHDGL